MAEKSGIAWTRSTFNPWIGCTKIGPGCDHCYAEALDKRMRYGKAVHWGVGVPRHRTSEGNWRLPLKWDALAKAERLLKERAPGHDFSGPLGFWPVFCASLADVFDNEIPWRWRVELWQLIEKTPNLSWLLVTKRIGNVYGMVPWAWQARFPDNVRLLITVCNQEEADRDIPKLLSLPCKNGISYEPALGPVDWAPWLLPSIPFPRSHPFVQWIIVGGESTQGKGTARPFEIDWAYSTITQCRSAGVPVFVKQLGDRPHWPTRLGPMGCALKARGGSDPSEWLSDLRVQEFPL